jgi:hypothetical protein
MATFGNTTIASVASGNKATGYINIFKFPLLENGYVSKLTAYLDGAGNTGAQVVEGLIFSDNANRAQTLKGKGTEVSIAQNAAAAWVDLPFASDIYLTAGTYWLGFQYGVVNNNIRLYREATGGYDDYESTYAYDSPPNPWVQTATVATKLASIYATYSTVARPTLAASQVASDIVVGWS